MDISVIVCTYNRSKELKKCLEALGHQVVPEYLSWEVLVVDNNSTDDTRKIVEETQRNNKLNISYVYEAQQGLSYARNRGVAEAKGSIIAYIDDDGVADVFWLGSIFKAFQDHNPDCVGGKIIPIEWPRKIPKWFNKELHSYVTIYDKGDEAIELKSYFGTPFGTNVSYKKSIFERVGLFDVSMGRMGQGSYVGGEEQDLNIKILKSGGKIWYQPAAIVYHPLRPEMLKKRYLRRLDFDTGKRNGLRFGAYNGRNVCGIPLYVFRQFIKSVFRYVRFVLKHGYNNSFRQELYCWYFAGFMRGRIKYKYGRKCNNLHI